MGLGLISHGVIAFTTTDGQSGLLIGCWLSFPFVAWLDRLHQADTTIALIDFLVLLLMVALLVAMLILGLYKAWVPEAFV